MATVEVYKSTNPYADITIGNYASEYTATSTESDANTLNEMLRQRYIGEIINNQTMSAIKNDIYQHYRNYNSSTTTNYLYDTTINGTNTTFYPFTFGTDNNIYAYDKKEIKKQQLKSNLLILVKSRANNEFLKNIPENEKTALETLREEVSEIEFRRYLKYGFILVKSKSGKTYQVFRNKSHTKVWFNGKIIEEICVRIKDSNIPLTDNVIAFKTLIEFDEEEFKKLGNVFKMAIAA